ncbi:hypothetical protein GQ44DRAFT_422039 [Phaeosphaeriaceae sp. PMI808]|nr:hypothetical protein GQ44DRAFT_422039 [Phaeosphaeriaceae sp. PMI808]
MAGDTMQTMPMSPQQSPAGFGGAMVQWACTRRGRMTLMSVLLFATLLVLGGMKNHEAISSQYHTLSSNYHWRPYLPHIPSIIHSPFKKPSNTTLQLENGQLTHVPQQLKKTTPNFHLVMPAEKDTDGFCKTTLSAMLLNYPPPTVANLHQDFDSEVQRERAALQAIRQYLHNTKYVQDEDLVLVVDGKNTWFQLPSDVIIKQYARMLEDANARLLEKYGVDKNGYQKINQSIIFAAEKWCEGDDMACAYAPHSILPADLYGNLETLKIANRPARYLDSKMLMGPVRDLKMLYQAALKKLDQKHNQRQTIQSVFATIFGEQQLRRDAEEEQNKPTSAKIKDLFTGKTTKSAPQRKLEAAMFSNTTQYEFSIGLDYTHTLFQPAAYCNEHELVPLLHDNSTDLSKYHNSNSWAQYLALPPALNISNPPFWRIDLAKNNPSPNTKTAYIDKLDFNNELDNLPNRKTPWTNISLLQNTYTGAVPAIILDNPMLRLNNPEHPPTANVTWFDMWYSPHKRALLRNYFRTPQSPNGYHNSLVGGDRAWDTRGGRGGVWTASEQVWLPWGEVDGVCGTLNQLRTVFDDNRGVWLHETENNGEQKRLDEEQELSKKKNEEEQKELKTKEEQEQKERANLERLKIEEEKKEKGDGWDEKEAERQKQAAAEIQRQKSEKLSGQGNSGINGESERERQARVAAEQQRQRMGKEKAREKSSRRNTGKAQSIERRWQA